MDESSRGRGQRAIALAALTTISGAIFTFTLASLAVSMSVSPSLLGVGTAVFWTAAALTSQLWGGLVSRWGVTRCLQISGAFSASALAVLLSGGGPITVVVAAALGGMANSSAHPSANQILRERVPASQLGIAFGIKHSANQVSNLLVGTLLAVVVVRWSWQPAIWILLALPVSLILISLTLGRQARRTRAGDPLSPPPARASWRPTFRLRQVGLACLLAAAASGIFIAYSPTWLQTALGSATGGTVLAIAGLAGVAVRVSVGRLADIGPPWLAEGVCAVLLLIGAAGAIAVALGSSSILLPVGVVLGISLGWGWPGLQQLIVTKENAQEVARGTAFVQAHVYTGAVIGPLVPVILGSLTAAPWAALTLSVGAALGFLHLAWNGRQPSRTL